MSPEEFILTLVGLVAFVAGYFIVGKVVDRLKGGKEESAADPYAYDHPPAEHEWEAVDPEVLPPPSSPAVPPPPPVMPVDDVRKRQEAEYKKFLREQKERNNE